MFGMDVFQIGGVAFRGSFVWCEDGGKWGWGGGYRGGRKFYFFGGKKNLL